MSIEAYQGRHPIIDSSAYVHATAVVIGNVTIGRDASIWPMSVIRGDVHGITIGEKTSIQDGAILHVTHDGMYTPGGKSLTIGHGVTVGHHVTLHACTIGNYCLVGMSSTVLDGAVLGDRLILGAGSLVAPGKVLKSGYLYVGQPARQARPLTEREETFLEYSADHYVRLKNTY